jgi:hypothetical protein
VLACTRAQTQVRHAQKGARLLAWGAYEAMLHGSEIGGVGSAGIGRSSCSDPDPIMPFKADGRPPGAVDAVPLADAA